MLRATQLPVARLAVQTARTGIALAAWCERQTLGLLHARIEATTAAPKALSAGTTTRTGGLTSKMQGLLSRALEQGTLVSREELFHKLLDQLVPDEARIIGALSDGSSSPLLHVCARTRTGSASVAVLENMSLIGKTANLTLSHLTPTYIGHLLSLGLVEIGPEDPTMKVQYEILAADPVVLNAIKQASKGALPARTVRYSLGLSALGRELWAAANQMSPTT